MKACCLIDQHVAHERVLFDKYRALEAERRTESQQLLVPETFDLTPAQAAVFDDLAPELEKYGFELMRLSGRTVAIKAMPADLPRSEARNMLAELLDTVDAEKKSTRARNSARRDCGLARVSRGDQSQHAARAREDALADRSTVANIFTDNVPTRPAGDPAPENPRHSQRLPPHLETGFTRFFRIHKNSSCSS